MDDQTVSRQDNKGVRPRSRLTTRTTTPSHRWLGRSMPSWISFRESHLFGAGPPKRTGHMDLRNPSVLQ